MTRKNIIRIAGALLLLIILGIIGGYLYLSHTKTTLAPDENGVVGGIAPVGNGGGYAVNNNNLGADLENVPQLRKISVTPVGGADIFDRKVGSTTRAYIRFVDRATGNIYETSTSSLETVRVTNTTVPKVNEAYFGAGGNSFIYRYTEDGDIVQTYFGKLSATSTELSGNFTFANVTPVVLSPSKNNFFYLYRANGGSVGYTSDFSGKKIQIFSHPLRDWQVAWPNENNLIFTTKPSSIAGGVSYLFNIKSKGLTKLMGPKNGLVVNPSPQADLLLFSETKNYALITGVYDIKTGQERTLERSTIPDKCIWGTVNKILYCGTPSLVAQGEYPDLWYQGLVSFNDIITSTDPVFLETKNLIDPFSEVGENIDAMDLHLSSDEKYLIFTNKKDLSLWGLRLD